MVMNSVQLMGADCVVYFTLLVDSMRCIDHTETKCDCKPSTWTLLYRHTGKQLDAILDALRQRAECLPRWIERVKSALDSKAKQKVG